MRCDHLRLKRVCGEYQKLDQVDPHRYGESVGAGNTSWPADKGSQAAASNDPNRVEGTISTRSNKSTFILRLHFDNESPGHQAYHDDIPRNIEFGAQSAGRRRDSLSCSWNPGKPSLRGLYGRRLCHALPCV